MSVENLKLWLKGEYVSPQDFKESLEKVIKQAERYKSALEELEELKQRISGDTPNCYECGSQIEFDGKYPKFTKTIEESKVINVCEKCF